MEDCYSLYRTISLSVAFTVVGLFVPTRTDEVAGDCVLLLAGLPIAVREGVRDEMREDCPEGPLQVSASIFVRFPSGQQDACPEVEGAVWGQYWCTTLEHSRGICRVVLRVAGGA